ncbi:MAG: prepilin-type N-terminal cleavage/methylation domain-containing protein [Proteobacteria bacterium]|nr:prepilin-type N-terminal cleavage/methylation domain-containing protein [Pseudomonadota bacterium]
MHNRHAAGFTLIELIAALILTALVGTAFVMALAFGTEQYILSNQTATLAQKSRLTLARMYIELAEIQGLDLAHKNQIDKTNFYYIDHNGNAGSITLSSGTLLMNSQYTLVDGVGTYGSGQALFTYHDGAGNSWTPADGFDDLNEIAIELRLTNPDGSSSTFVHSVNPRGSRIPNAPQME